MPPGTSTTPQSAAPPLPFRASDFELSKTCKHRQLSGRSGRGVMGHHKKPTSTIGDGLVGWLGGGGCTFVSGAICAQSGRSRSPEPIPTAAKHLQHIGKVGAPCGSSGNGWGGQVVRKQLIWESATSTVWPRLSQSFAAGRRGSTGHAQLKLAICFPTEVGKQMARSLS